MGKEEIFKKSEKAKVALIDYAESHIAYYNAEIREAFLNDNRGDFDNVVKATVDETISDVINGKLNISEELEDGEFGELYREMYEDGEIANAVYAEISDRLYAKHAEIDKGRQAAHDMGLPYDEYPYDPEENFDPYAYDPNRMTDEDYDRMHALLDAERTEEKLQIEKRRNFMKITIEGSSREIAELAKVLSVVENKAKSDGFPPLLTELVGEDFSGKENAPQVEAAEQEYVDPIAFEEIVCKFADCIRNRPGKNGKIRKYKDMKLSEFVRGDLFLK